jgi:alkylhydroperoxidase family enzyme
MARISLQADSAADDSEVARAIRQRRGGRLLKMDRVMLHSPTYAAAWNSFLKVVINDLSPSLKMRELIMCVVGVLNEAAYEVFSHAPKFLAAGGTQNQLDALRDITVAQVDTLLFNKEERAIIKLSAEMTLRVRVSPETFEEVRAAVKDNMQLVDLVGLIATYNMVSRFVVALDLNADDGSL